MSTSADSSSRTVYVLGAGFSYDASIPLQSKILDSIRDMDFVSLPERLQSYCSEHQGRSIEFVNKIFAHSNNPALEDVFTLLDESINSHCYCLGYDYRKLEEIRRSFYSIIVLLFLAHEEKVDGNAWAFYRKVSQYLIKQRLDAGLNTHSFSIISLNWDCILDDSIYWALRQHKQNDTDIDYCCFTHPFEGTTRHTPSILQRAKGIYNIKVMKLHGSVNWVICPNCNCMFVGLGSKPEVVYRYLTEKECPECAKVIKRPDETFRLPVLEPFIISPTFIKQFDNPHIGYIWHNAYRELSKAAKVVFIGYSLPYADYHLRTLLKRAIQPDTEIETVLVEKDKAPENSDVRSCYAASRYEEFFGTGKVKIYFGGVKKYFEKMI